MTLHKNKFLTTVAAAALALAVGACSSSSDDDESNLDNARLRQLQEIQLHQHGQQLRRLPTLAERPGGRSGGSDRRT